ncbi:hypothetical protein DFJ74DRAFT_757120 [Hyaloraphidium curvatum]|nr:hypothetical protein DFJ74DRAFT_757120 [Hyaloraphidium curvatum]
MRGPRLLLPALLACLALLVRAAAGSQDAATYRNEHTATHFFLDFKQPNTTYNHRVKTGATFSVWRSLCGLPGHRDHHERNEEHAAWYPMGFSADNSGHGVQCIELFISECTRQNAHGMMAHADCGELFGDWVLTVRGLCLHLPKSRVYVVGKACMWTTGD